jgi:hypothetical protein
MILQSAMMVTSMTKKKKKKSKNQHSTPVGQSHWPATGLRGWRFGECKLCANHAAVVTKFDVRLSLDAGANSPDLAGTGIASDRTFVLTLDGSDVWEYVVPVRRRAGLHRRQKT